MGELVDGWLEMDDRKKTVLVMDRACTDDRVGWAVKNVEISVQMNLDNQQVIVAYYSSSCMHVHHIICHLIWSARCYMGRSALVCLAHAALDTDEMT